MVSAAVRRTRSEGFVLVVDDSREVLDLLAAWLRREGYRVVTAESAAAALEVWAAEEPGSRPSALVADVYLPGGSGFALAHRLRDTVPDLHVVFISGYPDPDPPPGVAVLSKPFGPEVFLRQVEQGFDRPIGV